MSLATCYEGLQYKTQSPPNFNLLPQATFQQNAWLELRTTQYFWVGGVLYTSVFAVYNLPCIIYHVLYTSEIAVYMLPCIAQ